MCIRDRAMYVISPNHLRLLYCSDGFYSLTGYAREEYLAITEKDAMGLIFPEDIPDKSPESLLSA